MKRIALTSLLSIVILSSCKQKDGLTEMTFETKEHSFDTIVQGDKVNFDFKFKNTGDEDLLISEAHGSCGCTVPEYPKEAIKPNESGVIKVVFSSTGKMGEQHKSVTLTTNTTAGNELLNISTVIIPKK